jgi:hypothetical protein
VSGAHKKRNKNDNYTQTRKIFGKWKMMIPVLDDGTKIKIKPKPFIP